MNKYPQYYDVNDTPVVVEYDAKTDEVFAKTAWGADYILGKILSDGHKITKEEFDRMAKHETI